MKDWHEMDRVEKLARMDEVFARVKENPCPVCGSALEPDPVGNQLIGFNGCCSKACARANHIGKALDMIWMAR